MAVLVESVLIFTECEDMRGKSQSRQSHSWHWLLRFLTTCVLLCWYKNLTVHVQISVNVERISVSVHEGVIKLSRGCIIVKNYEEAKKTFQKATSVIGSAQRSHVQRPAQHERVAEIHKITKSPRSFLLNLLLRSNHSRTSETQKKN